MKRVAGALALVAVMIAAACGGANGNKTDDGASPRTTVTIGRAGSRRVTTTDHVAMAAPPRAYAVRYRVEQAYGGRVTTTTATLLVDRPFRTRLEIRGGAREVSLRVAQLGYLGTRTGSRARVLTASPAASFEAMRPDLVLTDTAGEVRSVLGRACEIHRLGAPLLDNNGTLVPGDTVDVCVDAGGLVLEQVERADGEVRRRWLATAVDETATVKDADVRLAGVTPQSPQEGGGSLQEIDPTTAPPGTFWQLDAPPPGFQRVGRYAVVPPQTARTDDENTRSQVIAGIVDVFTQGGDVLIVDQGGTLGQVPPFGAADNSTGVDLGELAKSAEWFPTPTGFEVRALLPPGRYVKVVGTLPVEDLIAVARSLYPITGTGITYR